MTNTVQATGTEFIIEWDMGEYAGFESYGEAYAYQKANRMVGSVIVEVVAE